jgi:hypothetical protein
MQGNSYDAHACAWEMDNSSGLPTFQVQFTANIHATDTGCDQTGGADAGIVVTPASGIGDVACYQQIVGLGTPVALVQQGVLGLPDGRLGRRRQQRDRRGRREGAGAGRAAEPLTVLDRSRLVLVDA